MILDQRDAVYFIESSVNFADETVSRESHFVFLLLADFAEGVSLGQGFELPGFVDSCIHVSICGVESLSPLIAARTWYIADTVKISLSLSVLGPFVSFRLAFILNILEEKM